MLKTPAGSAWKSSGVSARSLRGVVEGAYLYRQRGTVEYKMTAAIESRPE